VAINRFIKNRVLLHENLCLNSSSATNKNKSPNFIIKYPVRMKIILIASSAFSCIEKILSSD
jgi:hypothetical protein